MNNKESDHKKSRKQSSSPLSQNRSDSIKEYNIICVHITELITLLLIFV